MCPADVGQHADGRVDDGAQGVHLAHLGDAGLEDADLCVLVHQPDGERHANLRIIASWRACDGLVRRNELIEPLLDHRFAVAAGDAYHRDVEFLAVQLGQVLQCLEGAGHAQEVGARVFFMGVGQCRYDEVAHAPVVEVAYVFMSVVALRAQGEKQSLLGKAQRAAVG